MLNSICGSLNMVKLTQMFISMIRIIVVDNTSDFQKYALLLRVSVFSIINFYSGCHTAHAARVHLLSVICMTFAITANQP